MRWSELTDRQQRLLKRLPAKVPYGDTVAVQLITAGLAYRKSIGRLDASDAGKAIRAASVGGEAVHGQVESDRSRDTPKDSLSGPTGEVGGVEPVVGRFSITKEWFERRADLEPDDGEIGAGIRRPEQ